ncbi:MAG: cellulase family glycosylhydrolase, partial [Clostridia bacterium]|nr:cellulase family glycosylhydrolase [Clostridia bacterium]
MRRFSNLIIVISLALVIATAIGIVGSFWLSNTSTPEPDYRFLRAVGNDFVDEQGNKVYLKGINAGGLFIQEEWMCPVESKDTLTTYNTLISRFGYDDAMTLIKAYQDAWWQEKDFDNIKELGFNLIRLPFAYFNIENQAGELVNFDKLDWFIDNCEDRDIYVILDLHGAYGSQNAKDHSGDTSGVKLFG